MANMDPAPAAPITGAQALAVQAQSQPIVTEPPNVEHARANLVKELADWAANVRSVRKPVFDRMRRDLKFVKPGNQWPGNVRGQKYEANLTHRVMRSRVSALYAKNPTVVVKRKPRRDFMMWDENPRTLMIASQSVSGMGPMDPMDAQAIILDYQQGFKRRQLINAIGDTLALLCNYFFGEQTPNFKAQIKQLIRRVEATGVGFIEVGFQRLMRKSPELLNSMRDVTAQISTIENMAKEIAQGLEQEDSATLEKLRQSLKDLQSRDDVTVREGIVYDFPRASDLLVDLNCTQLKGFVGADRVARQYFYTASRVRELFNVDVKGHAKLFNVLNGREISGPGKGDNTGVCVLRILEKSTNLEYWICEGWPDFIREPSAPALEFEDFWPWAVLSYHDAEAEETTDIYPASTFELVRPMNLEYNRAREARRLHRIASRPAYISTKTAWTKQDKFKLQNHGDFEVIELELPAEAMNLKVEDLLAAKPVAKIDPEVYEVESIFTDVQRVIGESEPNFGGTSGSTATEATIAEQSRLNTNNADVDELDEFLSVVARMTGQTCLREMSAEQVKKIVGAGAVWPELGATEIAEELYLEVKAGSSGRPNKAIDVANFERLAPLLMQIPGLTPEWMAKEGAKRLDDAIDISEAFDPMMPSILSMNSVKQPSTGDPETSPEKQGPKGEQNSVTVANDRPGPKPDIPPFTGQPGP